VLLEQHVALPVLVAVDAAAPAVVEDRLLDLHLDQLALFLHDDDQVQPLGPVLEALHVERPGLADLVGGDAEPLGLRLVDAERVERPDRSSQFLPAATKPIFAPGLPCTAFVDAIGAGEGLRREALVAQQALLLRDPVSPRRMLSPPLGHLELGIGELHPVGAAIDDRRGLHRVLHQLQAHPDPGEAAEREP
jgi:hypothetical protein